MLHFKLSEWTDIPLEGATFLGTSSQMNNISIFV